MSAAGLADAQNKMRAAHVAQPAIEVFTHYYRQLEQGVTGLLPEATIEPLVDPVFLAEVEVSAEEARAALAQTVVIKLNGGLGTSMGMDSAKSLLPVRAGKSFLDITVEQVRHARSVYDARLPLLLMNSFRTRTDSLAALSRHPDLPVAGLPSDFMQNQEPKLLADDLTPVVWPADPSLEWCPPGHGDIYTALQGSGVLQQLLDGGYRYACTSNADNLGATPDARLAAWFAESGAPFAAEVCRRTPADRKGGHLARRRSDGQLILREVAQTAAEDMQWFTDENRHPYFNTNNVWFDLQALSTALAERGAVLGLPLIRNVKNVDPTDPTSPRVYQVETAMGAALEVFPGAQAIVVDRSRFLPVKTTNDLLLMRSDCYDLGEDGQLRLVTRQAPVVDLDPEHYRTLAAFDARFPAGSPSLAQADGLRVRGDWTFGAQVTVIEDAELADAGEPRLVPDGAVIGPDGVAGL